MSLHLGSGAHLLIQCPFQLTITGSIVFGHGEQTETTSPLFALLNQDVSEARMLDSHVIQLSFGEGAQLQIIPETNGHESYVVNTRFGTTPVLLDVR